MPDGREVSEPWAVETDLPTNKGDAPAPWTWPDLLLLSSELLYGMTGRRYRGVGRRTVTVIDPRDHPIPSTPAWLPAGVGDGPHGWLPLEHGWGRQAVVALPSPPVTQLVAVTIDGTTVDPTTYTCSRSGLLRRLGDWEWPVDGGLTVTYDSGRRPPRGGRSACVKLALELGKVAPGSTVATAELSNTISSIVREGTTVTTTPVASLREAITGGYTGLPAVDLWIRTNRASTPASVCTPDIPRARTTVPTLTP